MNWHYLWWVPAVVGWFGFHAWLSKQHNDADHWRWGIAMFLVGCVPLWIVVSKVSRNLLFDGMLFDTLLSAAFVVTMIALGAGAKFSVINWAGVGAVCAGFVLMRLGK